MPACILTKIADHIPAIPGIEFGSGDIQVSVLRRADGFSELITFSQVDKGEVGRSPQEDGIKVSELNQPFFGMVFRSVASVDVVIRCLEAVKESLASAPALSTSEDPHINSPLPT